MSAPNKNHDPVEVAALAPAAIEAAVDDALAAIAAADSLDELKRLRPAHQGDRSPLALANREIGALPPQARKEAGQRVGQARGRVGQAFADRQTQLEAERDARILVEEAQDVTARVARRPVGRRHPIELMSERIADLFVGMGWEIAEGPEVEAEWFNFDALNFDADHPARQMQDTFYLEPSDGGLVMRTHTSPVQARAMLERGVPIYVAAIGRVFRTDELDATHMPAFHQVEGLAVDEGITMAHLKGTLDRLATELFGEGITTRLRPSYFPFTEPSVAFTSLSAMITVLQAIAHCAAMPFSSLRSLLSACAFSPFQTVSSPTLVSSRSDPKASSRQCRKQGVGDALVRHADVVHYECDLPQLDGVAWADLAGGRAEALAMARSLVIQTAVGHSPAEVMV